MRIQKKQKNCTINYTISCTINSRTCRKRPLQYLKSSMLIEVILTFVFVIAILGVTSKVSNGAVAGIVIGLTLTLVHVFGIHFTGTSVNPARSFGPAIFAGGAAFANVWVFIIAPLVGGVLAAVVYGFLDNGSKEPEEASAPAVKSTTSSAPRPKTAGKKKRK